MNKIKINFNKRGAGNLEIIISFVIFIGFVFFVFLVFPASNSSESSVGLDAAERGIMNYTGSELMYFSASFRDADVKSDYWNCFGFNPGIEIEKMIASDKNDAFVNSMSAGNMIYVRGSDNFYQFYSSSEFEERSFDYSACNILSSEDFEMSSLRKSGVILYSRLESLNSTYYSDYSRLLTEFNMPKRENFGFVLRKTGGEEIMRSLRSGFDSSDVIAREIPVQVIYSNGGWEYAILNIRAW